MEHLNLASFKEKIFDYEAEQDWNFRGERPVVIDFYADWCTPYCRFLLLKC